MSASTAEEILRTAAKKTALGIVVAIVAGLFGRVIFHGWVQFDDPVHVTDNPHFFPVTWASLGDVWLRPYEFLYIPVSYTLFAAECLATRWLTSGGPSAPVGAGLFHAVSLGLHVANVLTVGRLLGRLVPERWMAALGAAVFAFHPLQVESIAWISEQRGLLAALLSLLGVTEFVRWLDDDPRLSFRRVSFVTASMLFALSLLAKPAAVTTPLIALAIGIHRGRQPMRKVAMALVPWFMLAAATVIITRASQPVDASVVPVPLQARPTIAADAIAWYATKVVLPVGLCVGYGRTPSVVLADPQTPLVAGLTTVVLAAVFFGRRFQATRLPVALFLSPLLPVLGFMSFVFQTQSTVADRYAYVAMLGPAAAVALLCGQRATHPTGRRWLLAATAAALVSFSLLASRQAATWQDTGTLARHACAVAPAVAPSWVLLATHDLTRQDSHEAVAASRRALEIDPKNFQGWINLGCGLAQAGDLAEAEKAFANARGLAASPRQWVELEANLGRLMLGEKRNAEAARAFVAALDRSPRHPAARHGLAVALTRLGEKAAAIKLFRGLLVDDPGSGAAWVGLGNAFLLSAEPLEAARCYGEALRIDPGDAETVANRARAWLDAGDLGAARSDVVTLRRLHYPVDDELSAAVGLSSGRDP